MDTLKFNIMGRKIECATNAVKLGKKIYPCTLSAAMDLVGGKWLYYTI